MASMLGPLAHRASMRLVLESLGHEGLVPPGKPADGKGAMDDSAAGGAAV